MGAYAELRELLIQAAPRHLVLSVAENLDEVEFAFAENGEVALEKMQSIEFDLVLMDLQMPVMDGIEASKRIRSSKASRNQIPIIALTANAGDSVEETLLEAGMNDFVTKPFQPDKLNHILRHWIP